MSDLHDLVGAYVIDALPAEELLTFRSHLEGCDRCQAEERDLRSALVEMSSELPPPAALRDRVLDAVASTPQEQLGEVIALPTRGAARWMRWAAVAAVVVMVAVGVIVTRPDTTARVLAAPDAVAYVLSGDLPGDATVTASNDVGAAVLVADGLPAPDGAEFYELWIIDESGPIPAGRFPTGTGEARFELPRTPAPGETLAITLEPVTGTDAPEGPVVLALEI